MQINKKAKGVSEDEVVISLAGGLFDNYPMGYLSCVFQWYAISACNYAQLIGWFVTRDKKQTRSYVEKVLPRVLEYRNKVAAHMSITVPYQSDNEADQATSILTQLSYTKRRLCAGALSPILLVDGKEVASSQNLSWSLTEEHSQLRLRYWPDGIKKAHQSIMIPAKTTREFTVNYPKLYNNE